MAALDATRTLHSASLVKRGHQVFGLLRAGVTVVLATVDQDLAALEHMGDSFVVIEEFEASGIIASDDHLAAMRRALEDAGVLDGDDALGPGVRLRK